VIRLASRVTAGSRALLCTLARRGKALQRDNPSRAATLLLAFQVHPIYKGTRVLFDLVELEDMMLDGPAPDPIGDVELARAVDKMSSAMVDVFGAMWDLASDLGEVKRPARHTPPPAYVPTNLPDLSATDYLHDLCVLGFILELDRMLASRGSDGRPSPD
jgi:hypothetical protein